MSKSTDILERITKVCYKSSVLSQEETEAFFNRRKRSMTFYVDNENILKIQQEKYGHLGVFYRNGSKKTFIGKVMTYEKSRYEEVFYIGIDINCEKERLSSLLYSRNLMEACIFYKMVNNIKDVRPDLRVFLNNNDNDIVYVPFIDNNKNIVYNKVMLREVALKENEEEVV